MQITKCKSHTQIGVIMYLEKDILQDRKIAILAADGFDEVQLFATKNALEKVGAKVVIVSLNKGKIKSWNNNKWGKSIDVDSTIDECSSDDFDGLVIPGGELNSGLLLKNEKVKDFIKEFSYGGKSIASICHGTKILIDNGMVKGKNLTTWPSHKKSAISSGARWRADEVVVHRGIITSCSPKESHSFNLKMIGDFAIAPRMRGTPLH